MEKGFKTKIISFLMSIIIVLLIFIGFIGLLFPFIIRSAVEHITVTSIIFSFIGLAIMLSSKYWPTLSFSSKEGDQDDKTVKQYHYIKPMIIGLTFLMSGFLYAFLKSYNAMIISFLIGIVLYRFIVFYLKLNNRKRDI